MDMITWRFTSLDEQMVFTKDTVFFLLLKQCFERCQLTAGGPDCGFLPHHTWFGHEIPRHCLLAGTCRKHVQQLRRPTATASPKWEFQTVCWSHLMLRMGPGDSFEQWFWLRFHFYIYMMATVHCLSINYYLVVIWMDSVRQIKLISTKPILKAHLSLRVEG